MVGIGFAFLLGVRLRPKNTSVAARQRRAMRSGGRGFSVVELLTVLAVIGILIVAAAPVFRRVLQESRVTAGAQRIADLYRTARMRAMGRGAATLVRWNASAVYPSAKQFSMREAVVNVGAGQQLPSSSCFATNWAKNSTTSRLISALDVRSGRLGPASAQFQATYNGIIMGFADLCFTPRGRTYVRWQSGNAFTALHSVPRIIIKNTNSNRTRYVVIPPSGAARVVTKI